MTQQTFPTSKDLLGGAATGVKFEAPGDTVEGTVVSWLIKPVTKMGTGEIDTFPSGDPKYQVVMTLQTNLRDDYDDDGKRTVYIKSHMFVAVKQAVATTGAEDFEKGAWVQIIYTGLGEAQRGMNAPKLFTASYKRPSAQLLAGQSIATDQQSHNGAIANVQAGLGGQAVQQQYAPQQPQQQYQQPAAPQYPNGQPAPQAVAPTGVQGYAPPQQQNPYAQPAQQAAAQDPNLGQLAAQIAAVRASGADPAAVFAASPAHLAVLAQLG